MVLVLRNDSVVGGPYTAADETTVYANSGLVAFAAGAGAFSTMLQFSFAKEVSWDFHFNCDWFLLSGSAQSVGYQINIDGFSAVRWTGESNARAASPVAAVHFVVPAGADLQVQLINVSASAVLVQANCTMVGKILSAEVKGIAAQDASGALGSAAKYVPKNIPPPDKSYPDADLFPDVPSVPTSSLFGRSKVW